MSDQRKWRLPSVQISNPTGLRTCWDCIHIRVGSFPERMCSKRHVHVYSGPESEVKENGTTVANDCPHYVLNPNFVKEPEWDEDSI